MMTNQVKWSFFIFIFFIISCAGTKLTHKQINEEFKGKPVSNILVIGIADNDKNRRAFENKFVAQLKKAGINAISSANVIPMPTDLKLEKEDILSVVKKYQNDAVIITHVKSLEEKEVRTRDARSRTSFYSYYGFVYGYANNSNYSGTNTSVLLETNLYDVKTEQLIWSGQSKTLKPESVNELLNDVIKVVIDDLQKNNLVVKK